MLVAFQSVCRHVGQMHGLSCPDSLLEQLLSRAHAPLFGLLDFVFGRGELHLAEIDDAVFPVDEEIDLGAIVFRGPRDLPGTVVGYDAGDAESRLDLAHMLKAEPFERILTKSYHTDMDLVKIVKINSR